MNYRNESDDNIKLYSYRELEIMLNRIAKNSFVPFTKKAIEDEIKSRKESISHSFK